jgi:glutamine synthetase
VVRIPGYAIEPNRKRFEFRPSDATANPYLAYAALMMAMFDGIENQIDPIEQGYGPIDVNIFKLTEEERRKIGALPKDLYEVIDAIENDQDYLLKSGVFTKAIIKDQIDYLKKEALAEGRQPSAREYKAYYDL